MHAAQKLKSKLKFVMLDKESNISTLWRREEFLRICSKEDLAEKDLHVAPSPQLYWGSVKFLAT